MREQSEVKSRCVFCGQPFQNNISTCCDTCQGCGKKIKMIGLLIIILAFSFSVMYFFQI